MRYCFDLDGTLCGWRADGRYELAKPFTERIDLVNELHDTGHEIIVYTARGDGTGIDWRGATIAQLRRWGLKYDRLELSKPAADVYVDDRAENSETWFLMRFTGLD